jgi:hypothetical protein
VVIRVQPYLPAVFKDVMNSIDLFHKAGVYGVIFEGMKYTVKKPGTIKLKGDFVYPVDELRKHFEVFKSKLHRLGMKFYSGENRLRSMGDSLCCCGIDGMGWRPNTANLNHRLYDKQSYVFTDKMKETGNTVVFYAMAQETMKRHFFKKHSFADIMEYMMSQGYYQCLIPEDK